MSVKYSDFIELCKKLENLQSRKEKIRTLADFLKRIEPEDARIAALLLSGRIFPEYKDMKLDIGVATVYKIIKNLNVRQSFLIERKLTLRDVYRLLEKIASIKGMDSRRRKEDILRNLLTSLSPNERDYLLRFIFGEVRIGVNEGLILEALSYALKCDIKIIRKAYMFIGDIGDLIYKAFTSDCEGLKNTKIELFRPVKPMLASMAYSVGEALRELGGRECAFEYKYDGVRIQVHKKEDKIRIFTRRLSDTTHSLPEVVDIVKYSVDASNIVLDGEVIGLKDGRPLPFQELVKRIKRQKNIHRMLKEIPVIPKFFDVLYLNGNTLVDFPYSKRWQLLENIIREEEYLSKRIVTDDIKEAEFFFEQAIKSGHEGLIAKKLDSNYTPGIRGKKWLKIKKTETIDAVIVAAEWGHGRRRGWLSDYYLAVVDDKSGEYVVVGKTFKGLTDEEFKEMTKRLLEIKIREEGYVVIVKPIIVVEVAYGEIQKSPKYKSGMALRFARITRIRFDKNPKEVTTLSELRERYEKQFEHKSL